MTFCVPPAWNQALMFPIMPLLTWKVFNVHTPKVAQSVLVVGGVVPNDAIIFAREVIKPAMDWRHPRQVIQHFLNLFNEFLEEYKEAMSGYRIFSNSDRGLYLPRSACLPQVNAGEIKVMEKYCKFGGKLWKSPCRVHYVAFCRFCFLIWLLPLFQ